MPTRRFEWTAPTQLLVGGCAVVFGACVLIEHTQSAAGLCAFLQRRCHRPFSIHPIPVLYLNRVTSPSRRQRDYLRDLIHKIRSSAG
jgi:hypothetical protein